MFKVGDRVAVVDDHLNDCQLTDRTGTVVEVTNRPYPIHVDMDVQVPYTDLDLFHPALFLESELKHLNK